MYVCIAEYMYVFHVCAEAYGGFQFSENEPLSRSWEMNPFSLQE